MDRQDQIRQVVRSILKNDTQLDSTTSLFDSGLMDSFDLPDLVSALEQHFSVVIPDSELDPRKFNSIADIEKYLATKE